jgi:hypothetical protein
VAKRKNYAAAQGQQGQYGGVESGIPFSVSNPASVTNGSIPAASFPLEVTLWTVPDRIPNDAFGAGPPYFDVNPSALEPAVKAAVDRIVFDLNAAFAATANSFLIVLRRRDSTGAQVGSDLTLFDGTVSTSVAFARITNNPVAASTFRSLNVGDTVNLRITIAGTGAASPAIGGTLDVQM